MLNSHQLLSLLLKLAKNKDYITLVKTLNDYPNYKRIGIGNLIFRISSDIVKIKMFRKIPKVTIKRTDTTRKAIYGCNYELALKLHNKISYSNYPNNALYAITFDSNKKRTMLSNNSVYTDWTGITNNGVSTFVQTYFDKLPTNDSYCKKGKWNSACDIRR